ncbi:cysteine peptidase family C39 domain-containing protein [Thiomonas sp. FB-6]|uniref:cysteine peptidase family C39 domain-containing protein n=1 Tax=Thiomonas sp. FB-6 TaxID=1158291 RepID=UPI000380536E|nr:cysteine peptidase family C39 domain-containing protein [Thiomonas sp. FB-6]
MRQAAVPKPAELPADERAATDDAGLSCLVLIARLHDLPADGPSLRDHLVRPSGALSPIDLLLGAKALGLSARAVKLHPSALEPAQLPCMALVPDGRHFVLARLESGKALVLDPANGRDDLLDGAQLTLRWDGESIVFGTFDETPEPRLRGPRAWLSDFGRVLGFLFGA